jgi:hypothetical protein
MRIMLCLHIPQEFPRISPEAIATMLANDNIEEKYRGKTDDEIYTMLFHEESEETSCE